MPKESAERIIDTPFGTPHPGAARASSGGGGGGGGATNLDALSDVTVSAPSTGQVLVYDSATGQWGNAASPGGLTAHGLSSAFHTGQLNWDLLNFSGSDLADIATRRHVDLQGMTPDDHHDQVHVLATGTALGPDHTISGAVAGEVLRALSATAAAFDVLQHTDLGNVLPNQHHNQQHLLATGTALGPDHTISGAAAGQVLRASSPTAAQFMQLNHTDLDNVLPNQHHNQVHNIVGTDHTISGSQFQVVGATATNVLGLLTPSSAPGAAAAILRTDSFGGIQLDTDLLYVDAGNNWIGVNRIASGATLDIIAFNNADHTQRIKRKSGQTGRMWRVEDLDGSELIVLDSVGNLQSGKPGFVSGLLGWQITPQGNAEFNNIWARGELHATVFVKDEIHATGGSLLVASAGTLHDDAVISATTVDEDTLVVYSTPAGMGVPLQVVTTATFTGNELHVTFASNVLNINDPPSGPAFYFQQGDIIRSKTEVATGVTDFWFEVNGATQYSGYAGYSVTKRSGTDGTLPKGSAVVSYGKEGDGRILLTSDLNYAPYIDVFTVGPQVWTGNAGSILPRVRMGRLDGIGLPGISGVTQYGIVMGKDLSDANSGYLIASNLQFSLYKIDMRLNNGAADTGLWTADGNLRIGSNVGADATTGFRVITTGPSAGDVIIGNEGTGNYLRWVQASGALLVQGTLTVAGGGGSVDQGYVDAHDAIVDANAQTYANTARDTAKDYGDGRRVVGVSGIWTSTANRITWTGLSVMLVNGGSRSIADGNTGTMSARTYLYINMSGAGTLVMGQTTNIATISSPNLVLIAVCDPGAQKASVSVVAGSTYISGGNIFTQSILANNIAANTITANEIAGHTITVDELAASVITTVADQATAVASGPRVLAVNGSFSSSGYRSISWGAPTNVTVVKANAGPVITIADGNITDGVTPSLPLLPLTSRLYLHILEGDSGSTVAMRAVNDIDDLPINAIMIAVVTPGTTGTNGTEKASIVMVNGGVLISGDSIAADSIVASNIKVGTITANEIASTYTSARDSYADSVAGSAQSASQAYGDARRVVGVSGTWGSNAYNTIFWTGASVKFANATSKTLLGPQGPSGNSFPFTGRVYFWVTVTDAAPMPVSMGSSITSIGINQALIAVADAGTPATGSPGTSGSGFATVQMMAGSTYISGDNIITGSIVASNIASGAITANKVTVDGNITIEGAGMLTLGPTGSIHSLAKDSYADVTPGYYLGYSGGQYVLDVGDADNYLRWSGSALALRMTQAIDVTTTAPNIIRIFSAANPTPTVARMFYFNSEFQFDKNLNAPSLTLGNVSCHFDPSDEPTTGMLYLTTGLRTNGRIHSNFQIEADGTIASVGTLIAQGSGSGGRLRITVHPAPPATPTAASGTRGDIIWGNDGSNDYLYVYVGGAWKRVLLSSW